MKKAKIMLSAIAVLAVVGGAFAFKANRIGSSLYYKSASVCVPNLHYNTENLGTTIAAPANSLYYNAVCTSTVPVAAKIYYTSAD